MSHFKRLRDACMNKWLFNLYSVFWAEDNTSKRWLCNVFVGDALFLNGNNNFMSSNKHYYDPLQVFNGFSKLKKRKSYKDVVVGDICVFGTKHIEIITKISKNLFADDGFCSIGAGRGSGRDFTGSIKCDEFFSNSTRELDNSNNSYYSVI